LVRKKDIVEDAIENLFKYIDKIRENEEKRIKHYKDKLDQLIRLREIKAKRIKTGKLSPIDVMLAQEVTCYGSLGFCCGPEKKCPYSFAVMDALGIDPEDFADYKRAVTYEYISSKIKVEKEE